MRRPSLVRKRSSLTGHVPAIKFDPFVVISNAMERLPDFMGSIASLVRSPELFQDLDARDIDFFVPQICVLLSLVGDSSEANRLQAIVLEKCSQSIHCAVKFVWYLNSMVEYCSSAMKDRIMELSRLCEIAMVNSMPPDFTDTLRASLIDLNQDEKNEEKDESFSPVREINEEGEVGSPLVRSHSASFLDDAVRTSDVKEETRIPSDGELGDKADPHEYTRSWGRKHTNSDAGDMVPFSKEFALFLAKQKRAEYFTEMLDFFLQLELLSKRLVEKPRNKRKEALQKELTKLDYMISDQGLYFPNCAASDPHYRILRIVSEESFPLSSRDKVPFMIFVEIVYTGRVCSSSKLHEVFRSSVKEVDMSESVETVQESQSSMWAKFRRKSNDEKVKSKSKLGRPFGELFHERRSRIKKLSPHGKLKGWDLMSMIVKVGDDCRQESLALQMIAHFDDIFQREKLPLKLFPFNCLVVSPITGLIEVVTDAVSVDSIKKNVKGFVSLFWFFENHFGPRDSKEFRQAQKSFVQSMAAYSLVTYLLQIKDRHNGNILIDAHGHVIHIDFGYMLSNSPGGNWGFESAPFKLTQEYVEVMEGEDSEAFADFKVRLTLVSC